MSENTFDHIVLGLGGMGSATLFELSRRGHRVLGIEQFGEAHPHGSSHGQTRIIRQAYYEDPGYVPLVQRAFEKWYELEQLSGKHLLTECDCLSVGSPESELIRGVLQAANEHGLAVDSLSAQEVKQRYPFQLPESMVGVRERSAGFLMVEECVRTYLNLAREKATIKLNEKVMDWKPVGNMIEVSTNRGKYRAGNLIVCAGPWAGKILREAGTKLSVMRQVMLWFGTSSPERFRRDRFPVFIADVPEGKFYGLPMIDSMGVKLAQHYGASELPAVEKIDRAVRPEDETTARSFLQKYLPELDGSLRQAKTCIYTLSPDRHFIIDFHPESENLIFATGFSGHGFKFASLIGEMLSDLAEQGDSAWWIPLFRRDRLT